MKIKSEKNKNRSGKAPCEICGVKMYLDIHHIEGRKIPNANASWNLVSICPNCHKLVHMGDLIIEQWATTTSGRELIWHWEGDEGDFRDSIPHLIKK